MIFRIFGKLCILLALMLLALGVYIWLSGGDIYQAAGQVWYQMHRQSLQYAQVITERYLYASWLWVFFQNAILTLPLWDAIMRVFIALLITGGVFIGLFRKAARGRFGRYKRKGLN